jgi:malonyl CoA-acyl carrier protein transacylase
MRAFIFPGQGSQAVGMGKALAEASAVAREVFQEVDDALGQSLFKLMCEGPEADLTLTENAQPAIMANAMATLRVLETEGGVKLSEKAHFVAGHSLGEYTALCAAGARSGDDGKAAQAARASDAGRCACRRRGDGGLARVQISKRRRRLPLLRRRAKPAPSPTTMIRHRL